MKCVHEKLRPGGYLDCNHPMIHEHCCACDPGVRYQDCTEFIPANREELKHKWTSIKVSQATLLRIDRELPVIRALAAGNGVFIRSKDDLINHLLDKWHP